MQTFVLFKSHIKTARVLDNMRLGKQRSETIQILDAILGKSEAYENHPAVAAWWEYPEALVMYGLVMCHEWRIVRGKQDHCWEQLAEIATELGMAGAITEKLPRADKIANPPWMDDLDVLRSHRSRLVEKMPRVYAAEFPDTPENMPYLWPQTMSKKVDPRGYRLRLSQADTIRLANRERVLPEWLTYDPDKREVLKAS